MKLTTLLLTLLCVSLSTTVFSQGTISGKIIDRETRLPLEGASVFAQNTTRGTVSDKEGNFSLSLVEGGYEVIISFTGYDSRTINYEAKGDRNFTMEMDKADNSMSEVVIRSSNEVTDGWEKYGSFFIEHFIGTTPSAAETKLDNPEALKFFYYKKSDRLKVLATEPLKITNRALGYTISILRILILTGAFAFFLNWKEHGKRSISGWIIAKKFIMDQNFILFVPILIKHLPKKVSPLTWPARPGETVLKD